MDPALQRRVQRYGWDKASSVYEAGWNQQLKPAQDLLLKMAGLRPGNAVIDIACGTGLISFRAAAQVTETGSVLGTDISEKMIEISTAAAKEKKQGNTLFARMDAEELTVPDGSFDAALCALGLMYLPDPAKGISEIYRVLKPGGRIAAAVWGQRANCGWAEIFEIVDRRVSSEVCPMFFSLGNGDSLSQQLARAGFSDIASERLSAPLCYGSVEEACSAAFEGGPVAMAYFRFTDSVKEEVRKEYIRSIEPYRKPAGYEVPGEFVVAVGRK
jgi:ubiquinone/menaquinone biosynthesis C-methylase UbiE